MELEGLAKDPNWKGETPAVKVSLTDKTTAHNYNSKAPYQIRQKVQPFMLDDQYGSSNPTMVLGSFNNFVESPVAGTGGGTTYHSSPTTELRCAQLTPSTRFTLSMPEFRLTDNIRSWPNNNKVHMWIAWGNVSELGGGTPKLGNDVNKALTSYKISRKDAKKKKWKGGPLLISRLPYESESFTMIWAVERGASSFKLDGDVKVNKDGVTLPVSFELKANGVKLLGDDHQNTYMEMYKCELLEDNYYVSGDAFDGNGNLITRTYENKKYPVIRHSQMEFTLRTRH
ncbi:hypothetical protein [Echinicola rosea]|nr:hypothetical protein [Echinicola rosea]